MRDLRIGLWVVQIMLAAAFLGAGLMKLTQPYEVLAQDQAWVNLFAPEVVKLIAVVEFLGALGLVLPAATRIAPRLTPLAAIGLTLVMIGAGLTHLRIGELPVPALIFGVLAAFVAWGRFAKAPILPRGAQERA